MQPEAVNVAFSPSQHTVLFDVITGAAGVVPVVMVTTLLAQVPVTPAGKVLVMVEDRKSTRLNSSHAS